MDEETAPASIDRIEALILVLRGQKVIVDADLARLFGVTTRELNQAVRRNASRFPPDFAFALREPEKAELITNCDRFKTLKHSAVLPLAFTEFGATMAANILNSDEAVRTSVFIVRAFVKMRAMLSASAEIRRRLTDLERQSGAHDESIRGIVSALRELTRVPAKPPRRIGFNHGERSG
jgi:hypothetical protein